MDSLHVKLHALGKEPRVWFKIPGYVIRNYTPDLEESVLYHMTTYFINEEPFCSSSKISADPNSLAEVTEWWRDIIRQNVSVIALPEGTPGADLKPITEPRIRLAGVNVLFVGFKDDPPSPPVDQLFQAQRVRNAIGPYMKISKQVPMFTKFNIDAYMDAAGLSVHPEERGRGLGAALLKARLEMCRELGLKATKTVFTSIASQKVALRCGFDISLELLYKDIVDDEGNPCFPLIPPTNRVLLTTKTIDI